jgi:hypothetical protein
MAIAMLLRQHAWRRRERRAALNPETQDMNARTDPLLADDTCPPSASISPGARDAGAWHLRAGTTPKRRSRKAVGAGAGRLGRARRACWTWPPSACARTWSRSRTSDAVADTPELRAAYNANAGPA